MNISSSNNPFAPVQTVYEQGANGTIIQKDIYVKTTVHQPAPPQPQPVFSYAPNFGFGNSASPWFGGYQPQLPLGGLFMSIIYNLMQMMSDMLRLCLCLNHNNGNSDNSAGNGGNDNTGATGSQNNDAQAPAPAPAPYTPPSNDYNPPVSQPPYTPPVVEEPPYNPPVEEPPYNPPVEEPPYTPTQPPVYNKVLGSAGLFGDPQFGIFTPGINVPQALRAFDSGIGNGQTVTLLNDADFGGLEIKATGVQVNPEDVNSTGIGSASFKSGNDLVVIHGNGDLLVNGVKRGNLNDAGLIAPIQLANGLTVSTASEIDGPNGQRAERFVISNGEYKITAAPRHPHPDAAAYLDMNFEELRPEAADNATGYRAAFSVNGNQRQFGIVDLLKLEPGDLAIA